MAAAVPKPFFFAAAATTPTAIDTRRRRGAFKEPICRRDEHASTGRARRISGELEENALIQPAGRESALKERIALEKRK